MPAEVISLLSSPEPASPARASPPIAATAAAAAAARTRKSTPPPKRKPSPRRAIDSDDPFADSPAGDGILPWSTHKPSFAAFKTLPNHTSKPRTQPAAVASDDIWSLDDDDDFLQAPPKRQRLQSGQHEVTARQPSLTAAKAPAPYSAQAKTPKTTVSERRISALEQVEFTSSPRPAAKPAKVKDSFLEDDDEYDPFASSSPPQRQKETRTAPASAARYGADDVEIRDDEEDSLFVGNTPRRDVVKKARQPSRPAAAWDPISSSAPLPTAAASSPARQSRPVKRSFSEVIALDDSDDDPKPHVDSDLDEFPDIDKLEAADPLAPIPRWKDPKQSRVPAPKKPRAPPKAPAVKRTAEELAKEKEEKAAQREAEGKRKLKEKELAKKEKLMEKQKAAALAEVNKLRTDKKVSTPEMIVDLPDSLSHTVKLQAETLLKDLDVQADSWTSPVDNVVRWRRKVRARYNEELGHWEPIPMRIEPENYAMVIMTAAEFVQRALAPDDTNGTLEAHVLSIQRQFPTQTLIYLLEGLTPWMKKNRALRNRQFVSAVLQPDAQPPPPPSTQPSRRPPKPPQTYIPPETIDTALLSLQILHAPRLLIHHTAAPIETAHWIAVFTQHISTVPYRRQREESNAAAAAFCMEAGQVRTGDGPRDTYVRMLQEIGRVTAPIAYGIAGEFGSVAELVRGLEEEGPLLLEAIRKSANKDGVVSDRAVGQAVSRRVFKIFTGRDEESTEV